MSEDLGADDCDLLTAAAYGTVPALFYGNHADSLLVLLDRWEAACGRLEVVERTRILGAIWDAAFSEDLYDERIIDDLARRGTELREGHAVSPARAAYDSFTVDLAYQLLPHQPAGTPEEFLCLFYSGRTDEAWEVMNGGELAYTDLAYYRDRRLALLQPAAPRLLLGLILGSWYPTGDLETVGDKPVVGVEVGWWQDLWFGRLIGEWRPGRTLEPYWLEKDGTVYLSDRWDAVLLGGEAGRRLVGGPNWQLNLFVGLGVDVVKPQYGEKDLLAALHTAVGGGLRYELEENRGWYLGLDVRNETVGDRNTDALNLGGSAWSVRLVLGRILAGDDQETARVLGR